MTNHATTDYKPVVTLYVYVFPAVIVRPTAGKEDKRWLQNVGFVYHI